MKLADIVPNPSQPRKDFDPDRLKELADNIKSIGLKQPIEVVPFQNGKYLIVDGERRYRICKDFLNLEEIPAKILHDLPAITTEQDAAIQSFIINDQRSGYTPQDKEAWIYNLYKTTGLSTRKLAVKLGVHHSSIDHYIEAYRFRQKLPPTMVGTLPLSFTALKQTAIIKDERIRIGFLKMIADKKIKQDTLEIAAAAKIISKATREAQEAFFAGLLSTKEVEETLKAPPEVLPRIDISDELSDEEKRDIIGRAPLIKEDRTGVVVDPGEYKKWYKEVVDKFGVVNVHAHGAWGLACEQGVMDATEHIEDEDLRLRVIELVVNYQYNKWSKQQSDRLEREEKMRVGLCGGANE